MAWNPTPSKIGSISTTFRSNLALPSWCGQIAYVAQRTQERLEESESCSSRIGSGSDFSRIGKLVRQPDKIFPRWGFSRASLRWVIFLTNFFLTTKSWVFFARRSKSRFTTIWARAQPVRVRSTYFLRCCVLVDHSNHCKARLRWVSRRSEEIRRAPTRDDGGRSHRRWP